MNSKQVIVAGDEEGGVRIYKRSGSTWTQDGTDIMGSSNTGESLMGSSVGLSADGKTGIFGGYRDNANAGAVWVISP
jgi:hypothetical protein